MKKLLTVFIAGLLISCVTPTVNQVELYGEVEDVIYFNGHYKHKVWCKTKEKYYRVVSDKLYQKGEIIKIK